MLLSIMVSIRFTPTVMRDCREIGMAMRAISVNSFLDYFDCFS